MSQSPPPSAALPARPFCLGLLQRRTALVLTGRGWLVLVAVVLALALGAAVWLRGAYHFLAVNAPVRGGVLVVEGWVGDEDLALATEEYRRGGYVVWCVTGEPLEKGSHLIAYHDYATLTVAAFTAMGGEPGVLQPVRWQTVRRDRTYASALALKAWLQEHGYPLDRVNIVTSGPHARRSRLLYEKAFGPGTQVGLTVSPERYFDPDRWWTTSMGFRSVMNELIAYVYARFFFRGR